MFNTILERRSRGTNQLASNDYDERGQYTRARAVPKF